MKQSLFYFAGQLGLMLQLRFFFQWIIDFSSLQQNSNFLLGAGSVGLLLLAFRLFDAVSDPIIGILSDFRKSKGEKRAVLMRWAIPFISLGLVLSFSSSFQFSSVLNWSLAFSGFFLFFSGYTLYCIPYWALIQDLNHADPGKKSHYSTLLGLGVFVATALSFLISPLLVVDLGYLYSSMSIVLLSIPLLLLPTFLESPKDEINHNNRQIMEFNFEKIIHPLRNTDFIRSLILIIPVQMAFTVLTAISPALVEIVLSQKKTFLTFLMGPVIIFATCSFFLLKKIIAQVGWQNCLYYACIIQAVLLILSYPIFLISGPSLSIFVILFGLFGVPIAAVLGLEAFVVTETSKDPHEIGLYFGTFNFLVKTFNGLALLFTGLIVEYASANNSAQVIMLFMASAGLLILISSILTKNQMINKA